MNSPNGWHVSSVTLDARPTGTPTAPSASTSRSLPPRLCAVQRPTLGPIYRNCTITFSIGSKPGHLSGEPQIAIQRIAIIKKEINQRLIFASGQHDSSVALADIENPFATGRCPDMHPNPSAPQMNSVVRVSAINVLDSRSVPRPRNTTIGFLPLSCRSITYGDHRQLSGGRQRCMQPDGLRPV